MVALVKLLIRAVFVASLVVILLWPSPVPLPKIRAPPKLSLGHICHIRADCTELCNRTTKAYEVVELGIEISWALDPPKWSADPAPYLLEDFVPWYERERLAKLRKEDL